MTVPPETWRKAVWSVVAQEASKRRSSRPLWARVRDACGLGSTTAQLVCADLGFDPETGERIEPAEAIR